ncbi:MAG: hypothetical protein ACTSPI_14235 [Candidatus Heimdallarchaeaceae archaeon]
MNELDARVLRIALTIEKCFPMCTKRECFELAEKWYEEAIRIYLEEVNHE